MLIITAALFPILAGIYFSTRRLETQSRRNDYYTATIIITDLLGILAAVFGRPVTLFTLAEGVSVSFGIDNIGRVALSAVLILYTAVTFYSYEYMLAEEDVPAFFLFHFVSMGAMIAVCTSSNLVTLYLCFELATLTSMPLVLHEKTKESIAAALKYLFYSIAGALMGLLGVFFVCYYGTGSRSFVWEGFLSPEKLAGHEGVVRIAIFIAIIGFGTKAGLYPMHGWLPTAHPIAPAPASALLSGIITKAGVLAIIRLVYYSVGPQLLRNTWVQYSWMSLCMLTIFMGSMMAFREKIMKKRLAYSSISQLSYILLGLSTLSVEGIRGGLLHLLAHSSAKGCLFLAAGVFIYKLGKRDVASLKGIGRFMPVTLSCFALASLSLVGIPPMAGFLSKWVIAGSLIGNAKGMFAIAAPVILLISALLTAGYLLPVVIDAFFPGRDFEGEDLAGCEPTRWITVPMICLCVVSLLVGVFGGTVMEVVI